MIATKQTSISVAPVHTDTILLGGILLAVSCVISFWLITHILPGLYSVSRDDDLLGGMWAMVATIFVYRYSHAENVRAALSRMSATLVSFVLCFVYLLFFPVHVSGMAALIGMGAIALTMMGRPDDTITTAVVMVVAAIDPHDAWRQPILRLIDTAVGVAVGVAAGWISGPSILSFAKNKSNDESMP